MELVTGSAELSLLSGRRGPTPRTRAALPFRQLDQFPPSELPRKLFERCLNLEGVRSRQSCLAPACSRALCLADSLAKGPVEAFIEGREFCHLHPLPDGSIHLTLPGPTIEAAVALGWAVRHPIHALGMNRNLVLVYAPRDAAEFEIVFSLVEHSLGFAKGTGVRSPNQNAAHAVV